MKNGKRDITVIAHIFYAGSWQKIRERVPDLLESATQVIVSVCHDHVAEEIVLPGVIILRVPNAGKDIGGKLAGIEYYQTFCKKTAYLVFLHDKTSPLSLDPEYWFNALYSIFDNDHLEDTLAYMQNHAQTGLIGCRRFVKSEHIGKGKFGTTNSTILGELMSAFGLRPRSFKYIAGTIFLVRSILFERFFSKYRPLAIRKMLEPGNVIDLDHGTYTHSLERALCFIPQSAGYQVRGI